jgi:flavin reductase (DIM6/NTAB) family NADH-FMN oxidoreductase RutF
MFVDKLISSYQEEIFHTIKNDWFLITVSDGQGVNMMTAAWGSLGIMWNKPIFNIVVRNTRHTYNLLEHATSFTCSFFPDEYKNELTYCGRHSGKDVDKVKETGLTPIEIDGHTLSKVYSFEQAHTLFCCNIASATPILPEHFIDSSIEKHYSNNDYHTMYTGYITRLMVKEGMEV